MALDYFVIGQRVALRSVPPDPTGSPPPQSAHRLDLAVCRPGPLVIGRLCAELRGDRIELLARMSGGDAAEREEALLLAARVCAKLAPFQVFARDGEGGDWRELRVEPSGDRASSMQELYRDPSRVVWNFEPLPWELLGPFVGELRAAVEEPRVLDLGCGMGNQAVRLEELSLEVHGVDVAPAAIERCRQWVRHPERFQVAAADALPFEDGSFDGVLDVGCLHCVGQERLGGAVAEVARVLRPGGLLYSRFLKPRDEAWLRSQSFEVPRLGLQPAEIEERLSPGFELSLLEDPQLVYVRGVRRPPGG